MLQDRSSLCGEDINMRSWPNCKLTTALLIKENTKADKLQLQSGRDGGRKKKNLYVCTVYCLVVVPATGGNKRRRLDLWVADIDINPAKWAARTNKPPSVRTEGIPGVISPGSRRATTITIDFIWRPEAVYSPSHHKQARHDWQQLRWSVFLFLFRWMPWVPPPLQSHRHRRCVAFSVAPPLSSCSQCACA